MRALMITGGIIVGLIILAIAIGTLWLNTYIHSAAFKSEVESRASQTLGGPVQIETIDFDIFHGVKLSGLAAQIDPSHAGGQGAVIVQVVRVNCTYSWMELFSRRLQLTGITLDQPQIILTKQATVPLVSSDTTPAPTASTPSGPTTAGTSAQGSAMPFQFVLDGVKVNDGSVTIKDATGTQIVALTGIQASANTSGYLEGKDVTGKVSVAQVAVPSGMKVTDFSTPVTYSNGAVQANPFEASAFAGKIGGDYMLGNTGPSILDLNGKGFDVAQLTAATISDSSAKLSGSLDFNSKWRGVETGVFDGEGDAVMTNGKLEGVKILQQLSSVLKIKELNDPIISKAQTHFLVQNQQAKFIGLQLDSTGFRLTGDGTIDFSGNLNANLVLILTRDTMGKLPKELAGSFVQQQDGTGSIAFQVTGTTSNPQTDLPTRLLLQNTQIKNVINKALNKFFH
jgi:uncharacterized protein involved in outer membrane biogenesis